MQSLLEARRCESVFDVTKAVARGFVALMATFAVVAPSWGANADVSVTVTPVPVSVSVSRADVTNYAATKVEIASATGNALNKLVFTLNATAPFVESSPSGLCQDQAGTVTCSINQLNGPATFTFFVLFAAPTAGTSIDYNWTFTYSQAGSPGSNSSSFDASGTASTGLTTTSTGAQQIELITFLPSFPSSFVTGNNATATALDVGTTRLQNPGGLGLKSEIKITESVEVGGLTNDTLSKLTTQISIPTVGGTLLPKVVTYELHRDSSTIRSFNKFSSVPLYYTSDPGEPWVVTMYPLQSCSDTSFYPTGSGPSATLPVCIAQRIGVKNNMVGNPSPSGVPYTAGDVGDWIFVIWALQNGRTQM